MGMRTVKILGLLAGLFMGMHAQSQSYVYFQDSQNPTYLEESWMELTPPSLLDRLGTDQRNFPVESVFPAHQGVNSLRLHWTSNTGGDWVAIAAGTGWAAKNLVGTDTLSFWFYSATSLAASALPKVFMEDVNNVKTTKFSITPYSADLLPNIWTRILIPMNLFFNAGDPVDFTQIKTVGYAQNLADGISHTLIIDDVRVFSGTGISPPVAPPTGLIAKGYDSHVFLTWHPNTEAFLQGYEIHQSIDGGATYHLRKLVAKEDTTCSDFVRSLGTNLSLVYRIKALNVANEASAFSDPAVCSTHDFSDEELKTMVEEATFRYFWDYAEPVTGMARERNGSGNTVTTGGSGFGVMALLVGIDRGFITRQEGIGRMLRILNFLGTADRFHGAWPHWLDATTGHVIAFSTQDDGADLVETAFMIQGLLAVRQYFQGSDADEQLIRQKITTLWEGIEWSWFRKDNGNVLYWHWSPNYGWVINFAIRGWMEASIVYMLAIASPTHPVPASLWNEGWAGASYYRNGKSFYGIKLDVGWDYGGPLFFSQYSFLGFDPRGKKDAFTNYFNNNRNTALIDRLYCIANSQHFTGYAANCWGLTASDDPDGYSAHEPTNDNGTISPTAALASMPYTPEYSMDALKHFYRDLGDKLWGNFGFYDAINQSRNWVASSYLAIDQGPIIGMIENERTQLLWNLFMANPEIQPMLDATGFVNDATAIAELKSWPVTIQPNPFNTLLTITSSKELSRIVITNLIGQEVMSVDHALAGVVQLDVSGLKSGMYIVSLYDLNGNVINRKMAKE
jgi:Uncharacterized protein conserved in bacteria